MKTLLSSGLIVCAMLTMTNCTTEVYPDPPTPSTTTTTTERTTLRAPYLGSGSVQTQTTQSY